MDFQAGQMQPQFEFVGFPGIYVSGLQPSGSVARVTQPFGLGWYVSGLGPCSAGLMHFVAALGQDVVIEIRPRAGAKGAGRVRVVGAA